MLYNTKPSQVEAVQWTGDNYDDVAEFAGSDVVKRQLRPLNSLGDHTTDLVLLAGVDGAQGWVPVPLGHWVVRSPGVLNDHWPVDPDYFANKYELA